MYVASYIQRNVLDNNISDISMLLSLSCPSLSLIMTAFCLWVLLALVLSMNDLKPLVNEWLSKAPHH